MEFGEVNCRHRGFKKEKIIHYEQQPLLALNFIKKKTRSIALNLRITFFFIGQLSKRSWVFCIMSYNALSRPVRPCSWQAKSIPHLVFLTGILIHSETSVCLSMAHVGIWNLGRVCCSVYDTIIMTKFIHSHPIIQIVVPLQSNEWHFTVNGNGFNCSVMSLCRRMCLSLSLLIAHVLLMWCVSEMEKKIKFVSFGISRNGNWWLGMLQVKSQLLYYHVVLQGIWMAWCKTGVTPSLMHCRCLKGRNCGRYLQPWADP